MRTFLIQNVLRRLRVPQSQVRLRLVSAFFLFLIGITAISPAIVPTAVQAVTVTAGYQAAVLSLDYSKELAPGAVGQVTVRFKNIGTSTWQRNTASYVSLYRWDPRTKVELASAFARPSWETAKRPVRIPAASVKAGATVDLAFPIAAPTKPGVYREEFVLAAENLAWIAYSPFVIEVRVGGASATPTPASPVTTVNTPSTSQSQPTTISSNDLRAEVVSKGGLAWQLDLNQTTNVRFLIKNTGTKTWKREGTGYISLYSVDASKKERVSAFAPTTGWLSRSHVVAMQEPQVAPGEVATFLFPIKAPRAPGVYQESFALASENIAWVGGSDITIPITILSNGEFVATAPPTAEATMPDGASTAPAPIASGEYAGALMLQGSKAITAIGGAQAQVSVGFKNVGTKTWSSYSVQLKRVTTQSGDQAVSLRDQSWNGAVEVVNLFGATKPGEIALASFSLRTPMHRGSYQAVFQLYGDSQFINGAEVIIPITVTADSGQSIPLPNTPASSPSTGSSSSPSAPTASQPPIETIPLTGDIASLPNEPIIRVGLFKTTDDQMQVRAKQVAVSVQQNGSEICRLESGQLTTVRYDRVNHVYVLQGGPCASQSSQLYIFRSVDGLAPMEIADFSRPVSWLPGANDNTFRTQLELRYTPATDAVWVINELPFEYYLHGIAETSDLSPTEFQRTLLTAARTYGYYHIQRGTKHANEFYTVDATYDQVYRGYGAEARSPGIVAAVDATRGQVVTYNGKLAITPYFSRSDGRTRSWGEVWYGGSQYPWLVGVPVPEDQGRTLWGHGVGLSASGALDMARAGKRYDYILKYFYTGIELRRAYK